VAPTFAFEKATAYSKLSLQIPSLHPTRIFSWAAQIFFCKSG
jgi:hypothetical protein